MTEPAADQAVFIGPNEPGPDGVLRPPAPPVAPVIVSSINGAGQSPGNAQPEGLN